jgi:hypothetical protein
MIQKSLGKPAVKSKSVQGSVLALMGGVMTVLELSGHLPIGMSTPATAAISGILSGIGGLWALFGSVTRKAPITSLF